MRLENLWKNLEGAIKINTPETRENIKHTLFESKVIIINIAEAFTTIVEKMFKIPVVTNKKYITTVNQLFGKFYSLILKFTPDSGLLYSYSRLPFNILFSNLGLVVELFRYFSIIKLEIELPILNPQYPFSMNVAIAILGFSLGAKAMKMEWSVSCVFSL